MGLFIVLAFSITSIIGHFVAHDSSCNNHIPNSMLSRYIQYYWWDCVCNGVIIERLVCSIYIYIYIYIYFFFFLKKNGIRIGLRPVPHALNKSFPQFTIPWIFLLIRYTFTLILVVGCLLLYRLTIFSLSLVVSHSNNHNKVYVKVCGYL